MSSFLNLRDKNALNTKKNKKKIRHLSSLAKARCIWALIKKKHMDVGYSSQDRALIFF